MRSWRARIPFQLSLYNLAAGSYTTTNGDGADAKGAGSWQNFSLQFQLLRWVLVGSGKHPPQPLACFDLSSPGCQQCPMPRPALLSQKPATVLSRACQMPQQHLNPLPAGRDGRMPNLLAQTGASQPGRSHLRPDPAGCPLLWALGMGKVGHSCWGLAHAGQGVLCLAWVWLMASDTKEGGSTHIGRTKTFLNQPTKFFLPDLEEAWRHWGCSYSCVQNI